MYKRLCVLLLVCSFLSQACFAIDVSAQSAILYEPETGTVLFEKNAREKRGIASTTKIMTAVVVLENAGLSEKVKIPKSVVGTEGTSMYLQENEVLSVSDLLYGLMLRSGNDAAMALAHYVGQGDTSSFVEMMNETAARIGMKDTVFKNPSGLPDEEHVSTAYDMALLSAKAMKISEFAKVVGTKEKNIPGRLLANHNKLLRLYDGATGIKTGYTKLSGRCLVSSAERGGMELIAVTLSAPDDWQDHTRMLDYGFNNFTLEEFKSANVKIPMLSVVGATEKAVSVRQGGDLSFLLRANERDKVKCDIYIPRFVYAPVTTGEVVGEIRYSLDGKTIGSSAIVTGEAVEEYSKPSFLDKMLNLFGEK